MVVAVGTRNHNTTAYVNIEICGPHFVSSLFFHVASLYSLSSKFILFLFYFTYHLLGESVDPAFGENQERLFFSLKIIFIKLKLKNYLKTPILHVHNTLKVDFFG